MNQRFILSLKCSACADGTFGVGCMLTCSGNCLNNDACEKSDGGCKKCAPGWEGHLCNKGKNIFNIKLDFKGVLIFFTITLCWFLILLQQLQQENSQ